MMKKPFIENLVQMYPKDGEQIANCDGYMGF